MARWIDISIPFDFRTGPTTIEAYPVGKVYARDDVATYAEAGGFVATARPKKRKSVKNAATDHGRADRVDQPDQPDDDRADDRLPVDPDASER